MLIVGIDPSIRDAGFAAINLIGREAFLVKHRSIPQRPSCDWVSRVFCLADYVVELLDELCEEYPDKEVRIFIELPSERGGTLGMAAKNSQAILKLASCTFAVAEAVRTYGSVQMVPVLEWKGNTPKAVTFKRMVRAWGNKLYDILNHNIIDAIGITTHGLKEVESEINESFRLNKYHI